MRMRALRQGLVLFVFGLLVTASCQGPGDYGGPGSDTCGVPCGEPCEVCGGDTCSGGYCDANGHCGDSGPPECPDRTRCGGTNFPACPVGQYCNHPDDGCYGPEYTGYCAPIETPCDHTACKGVCGCDGVQYCNECEAHEHNVETHEYVECKPLAALCKDFADAIQQAIAKATECDACNYGDECAGSQFLDECGAFYVAGHGHEKDAAAVSPLVQKYFAYKCDASASHCPFPRETGVKSTCELQKGACDGHCTPGLAHVDN